MIGIPAVSGAVRRRKLYEDVAARLEGMIHDGHFLPGDQLPSERDLMKQFGVGRPAVREALFALRKMGLVAVNSGERAKVTRPTLEAVVESLSGAARHMLSARDGVRSFQQARSFFEAGLARHAAEHAGDDDLRELGRALAANRESIGSIKDFERTDVAFHYVLALIPRNPIFAALHEAMVSWLTEQRTITLQHPGQNEIAYRAHEQIFAAVSAGDPDRAERVIRAHLDQVSETYWTIREGGDERLHRDGGFPVETRNVRAFPRTHRRKRAGFGT